MTFYIQTSERSLFEEQGLDSFQSFMAEGVAKVNRLVLSDGSVFYIKRCGADATSVYLRMLLYGRRPRSSALRELQLLQILRSSGFLTMEPVAWGEESLFGIPLRGFLVVREVRGQDVSVLFEELNGLQKRALMKSIGRLVGRLHTAGFFHPVRLKDMIRTDDGLVLIDRETSKPWRSVFLRCKCLSSLETSARRTLREGHRIGAGSACAFLKGYRRGVAEHWKVWPQDLTSQVCLAWRNAARKIKST
jgi:tRNA A-37 threonylcarbamoyl transferase component Bud32